MSNRYSYDVESQSYGYAGEASRSRFLVQTYLHLFGAIVAFVMIQVALFQSGMAAQMVAALSGSKYGILLLVGGFVLVSWVATHVAHSARSKLAQYAALAAFVALEALFFIPILFWASQKAPGIIGSAAVISLGGFALLTGIVFLTRADFSFMRGVLMWAGICALLAIVGSLIFGFNLGLWFSVAMVAFAGACILYDTSNVLHHYPEDRYVGAALELFASVAMMFYYVLRIFMQSRD